MKIKSLFFALCMVAASANAQFTFIDSAGTPVESGTTVTYGQDQVGDPDGFYNYFVVNDAAEAIFMKAELASAENTDGSFFEICFGLCYDEIEIGQKFPANGSVFIGQGEQTLPGNHLGNTLANDDPRTFTFRYYQTDQAGTTELGNDFFITYFIITMNIFISIINFKISTYRKIFRSSFYILRSWGIKITFGEC